MLLTIGGVAHSKKAAKPAITMYRSPSCGCCLKWAEVARSAGYPVEVVPSDDIMAVKAKLGVPQSVTSCHTATVAGYVVEGHVPIAAIDKLLRTKPKAIAGIGVAGMPAGSPGMETDDGRKDPLVVLAFDSRGRTSRFA